MSAYHLILSSKYFEGDEDAPEINKCYVFLTKHGVNFSIEPALGFGDIEKGDFKIEHPNKDVIKKPFKKEITFNSSRNR